MAITKEDITFGYGCVYTKSGDLEIWEGDSPSVVNASIYKIERSSSNKKGYYQLLLSYTIPVGYSTDYLSGPYTYTYVGWWPKNYCWTDYHGAICYFSPLRRKITYYNIRTYEVYLKTKSGTEYGINNTGTSISLTLYVQFDEDKSTPNIFGSRSNNSNFGIELRSYMYVNFTDGTRVLSNMVYTTFHSYNTSTRNISFFVSYSKTPKSVYIRSHFYGDNSSDWKSSEWFKYCYDDNVNRIYPYFNYKKTVSL